MVSGRGISMYISISKIVCYTCRLFVKKSDLVKFGMCTLVSSVQMTFYVSRKMYTVPGDQDTLDKLNQIQEIIHILFFYGENSLLQFLILITVRVFE